MHFIHFLPRLKRFISEKKLLEWFPPFWFMGVKVTYIASDYRTLTVRLPVRWYGKNVYGTLFGGFLCAASDPLPLLLCERIFPGIQGWTRMHKVEFLKPARDTLTLKLEIAQKDIDAIQADIDRERESNYTFKYSFRDQREREIARVETTVFLRKKITSQDAI